MPITGQVTVDGEGYLMPNPEAFEVGISELLAGGLIVGPQYFDRKRKDPRKPTLLEISRYKKKKRREAKEAKLKKMRESRDFKYRFYKPRR